LKSAGAIRHKINQIRFRHLKKRLEAELRQTPGNCAFNVTVPQPILPTGQFHNGTPIGVPLPTGDPSPVGFGLCLFGAGDIVKWKPTFCDEQVDGGLRAKKCSDFCPRRAKEQVKAEFARELGEMSLAEVAYNYPDLAALIWVLDATDLPMEGTSDMEPSLEEPARLMEEPARLMEERPVVPPVVEPEVLAPTETPAPTVELPEVVPPKTWWSRLIGGVF
jgi:hypothetical protein